MRPFHGILTAGVLASAAVLAIAQSPNNGWREPPRRRDNTESPVNRLLAFDANKDGQLSKVELNDERLQALFERADENKDEKLTKIELVAYFDKELAQAGGQGGGQGGGQRGGPGAGGPGGRGPGGPPPGGGGGGRGPGGPGQGGGQGFGGQGGFGGSPQQGQQMGQMSPMMMLEALNLSDQQRKQVQDLQREFDARIEKILTADQKKQLNDLRARGMGGAGGGGQGGSGPGVGGAGGQGAGPGGQGGGAQGGGPGNAEPGGRGPAGGARPGAKKN